MAYLQGFYSCIAIIQDTILNSISNQLSGISNDINWNTQQLYASKDILGKMSYFAEVTKENSRILVDVNRDRWGVLRNRDGFAIW